VKLSSKSSPHTVRATERSSIDFSVLAAKIRQWGRELGFQAVGIADTDLSTHETHLLDWLRREYHGEMDYMRRHGTKRSRPQVLVPIHPAYHRLSGDHRARLSELQPKRTSHGKSYRISRDRKRGMLVRWMCVSMSIFNSSSLYVPWSILQIFKSLYIQGRK